MFEVLGRFMSELQGKGHTLRIRKHRNEWEVVISVWDEGQIRTEARNEELFAALRQAMREANPDFVFGDEVAEAEVEEVAQPVQPEKERPEQRRERKIKEAGERKKQREADEERKRTLEARAAKKARAAEARRRSRANVMRRR